MDIVNCKCSLSEIALDLVPAKKLSWNALQSTKSVLASRYKWTEAKGKGVKCKWRVLCFAQYASRANSLSRQHNS